MRMATMDTSRTEPEVIPPGAKIPQSYASWLLDPMNGETLKGISDKLRELIESLEMFASEYRGGKIKGKLIIEHSFEIKNGAYAILTDVKLKLPQEPSFGSLFFLQSDGSLKSSNPRQLAMPFTVSEDKSDK